MIKMVYHIIEKIIQAISYMMAFLFGKKMANDNQKKTAITIKNKQLDLAARARRDADSLLRRMRRGQL